MASMVSHQHAGRHLRVVVRHLLDLGRLRQLAFLQNMADNEQPGVEFLSQIVASVCSPMALPGRQIPQ